MDIYDVIVRPWITEKTGMLMGEGQYVFQVNRRANKNQIKQAVEEIYKVDVVSVNVMNMPSKGSKMRGRRQIVRVAPWKKAIVTLAPNQRIEALEA